MTSRNSFMAEQTELLKRRLWPIALSILLPFLYFVIGEALVFTELMASKSFYKGSDWEYQLTITFANFFGAESPAVFITIGLAIVLAMQGFAWLDNRRQLDFYESQPISRVHRFVQIIVNSFAIYTISFFVMTLLGLMIAYGFGVVNAHPVLTAALFFGRHFFLFYATYMLTLLAVMLTGNILIACLGTAVFLGYEVVLRTILKILAYSYLNGWYSKENDTLKALTSPLFLSVNSRMTAFLGNAIFGTILLILAYIAYSKRKNEAAGNAVIFKPVRLLVKVAITLLGALAIGIVFSSDAIGLVGSILLMILAGFIIASIMEIIYHYDFKALFANLPFHIIGIVAAILVFTGFYSDFFKFSQWRADPQKTDYAYISLNEYWTEHYYENGENTPLTRDFPKEYMRLTDIEAVNKLLDLGLKTNKGELPLKNEYATLSVDVFYHLKNKKTVARSIAIPLTKLSKQPEIEALYNKIFGSDEFKQGYFQIYHDQFLSQKDTHLSIRYTNGSQEDSMTKVDGEFYQKLNAAYLKDLQKFDYTLATTNRAIGNIVIRFDLANEQDSGSIYYPVYDSYDSTIAFLKEAGLYIEPIDTLSDEMSEYFYSIQAPFDTYFQSIYWEE